MKTTIVRLFGMRKLSRGNNPFLFLLLHRVINSKIILFLSIILKWYELIILTTCKNAHLLTLTFCSDPFFSRLRNKAPKIGGYNVNADTTSVIAAAAGDIIIISQPYLMRAPSAL